MKMGQKIKKFKKYLLSKEVINIFIVMMEKNEIGKLDQMRLQHIMCSTIQ